MFLNSGHTKIYVAGINSRWNASNKTSFVVFGAHYNSDLKDLWDNGDRGTKQANSATETDN